MFLLKFVLKKEEGINNSSAMPLKHMQTTALGDCLPRKLAKVLYLSKGMLYSANRYSQAGSVECYGGLYRSPPPQAPSLALNCRDNQVSIT